MRFKYLTLAAALGLAACTPKTSAPEAEETVPTDDDVILHAWSWSFDTIAANMKQIADAGFDYVQTSPANTCYVGEDGGMALFGTEENGLKGKWYYHYQPIDCKVGNYQLGTREQFKAMADSAAKYGVRIIVDVLPNHTAFDRSAVTADFIAAVGGKDSLYHANGLNDITEWNDRLQCTTGAMGGLPDVNTENPAFQKYYMEYVNDLLSLGARGFRYDTAKHIGLPSDPLDPKSKRNNFWDVATGREAVDGVKLSMPMDSLFVYGEVLQDKNVKEDEYAQYVDLTASNYGHVLRHALELGRADADSMAILDWHAPVDPTKLVTWVESHDTYANAHESAGLTDDQIRAGWVFLTARQHGTPLFFSRPAGRTPDNYWGNNVLGARGNDEFFNPEVVAVNKFRKEMSGMPEAIVVSEDGTVAEVERGHRGAAVVNFSDKARDIELPTSLPDGDYTDGVHNADFVVSGGVLKGTVAPLTSYLLYAK